MPLHGILEVKHFDVTRIEFMGHFVWSNQNLYIPVAVDYASSGLKQ